MNRVECDPHCPHCAIVRWTRRTLLTLAAIALAIAACIYCSGCISRQYELNFYGEQPVTITVNGTVTHETPITPTVKASLK